MKRILRRIGIGLAILAGLLVLVVASIYVLSDIRLNRKHPVPNMPHLTLTTDKATIERGEHLAASTVNCTFCHGDDLGGKIFPKTGDIGIVVAPNLTRGRGGIDANFTDQDWIRAIRHGVRPDGRSLVVMPSEALVHMSQEDLSSLISYLKQIPPVNRELPSTELYLLGRTLLVAGKLSILVAEKTPTIALKSIKAEPTPEYGRYLADVSGCRGCHGLNLSGGRTAGPPGTPLTSNLTPSGPIRSWSETEFMRTLRTGIRPNGTKIDDFMPWREAGKMSDEELHAIWIYLKSVPPKAFGNR